ncbi:hypothetical protein STAQ_16520 [Allostella sp. ATCC 35155]|nr:hypothetical protein STAQ_16520 [Stella sp. ATCC 35155]
MRDFDPVALFAILEESLGDWFWPLVALTVALAVAVVLAAVRLRRPGRGGRRAVAMAIAAGAVAAIGFFFAVPVWTLAGIDSLNGPVDYLMAAAMALVPAAVVAALVFIAAAARGRRNGLAAS